MFQAEFQVVGYDIFKSLFHKINNRGSLIAINKKQEANFFQNIPRTRNIVSNGTIQNDLLNQRQKDTFSVNINFSDSSISQVDIVNDYVQRFIVNNQVKIFDVEDLFFIPQVKKPNCLSFDGKSFTLQLPNLQSKFNDSDKVAEYSQLRMSQESLTIAAGLIGSLHSYDEFEYWMTKLCQKLFRSVLMPRFGKDIKKQSNTQSFNSYITEQIQQLDDCYIGNLSFLLLSEASILLKLIRKFFQCNEIITGILKIINATIQRDQLTYSNITNQNLLDVISDFGVIYNNVQQKQTGIDKIDQITRKKHNKDNKTIQNLTKLKKAIVDKTPEEKLDAQFLQFLQSEKKSYLLFILRHKFKLIFEGNFTEQIDKLLFNDDIFNSNK